MAPRTSGRSQKKIVPSVPEEDLNGKDAKASAEAVALANKTLEQEAAQSDHKRNQRAKSAVHNCALAVGILWVGVYLVFLAIWAFHLLTPLKYHFLIDAQINVLQSFVLSGTVAGFLSKYFDKNGS